MSKVYESLKEVVHDSLQRNKNNLIPLARVKPSDASNLNEEIDKLEKLVTQKIGRLKTAIKQGEEIVNDESQRTEQTIVSLRVTVATLENKLKEAEETIRRKEFAREKMEESLTAKIDGLQNEVKTNEEALQDCETEISSLKSNRDVLSRQITDLESGIEQAKADTATEAKRNEQLTEAYGKNIVALETKLRAAEENVRKKDVSIKDLEQKLANGVQNFEKQLKNKEIFLAKQKREINDLKSQLETMKRGISEVSLFFKQAEALTGVDSQNCGTVKAGQPLNGVTSKSPALEMSVPPEAPKAIEVQSIVPANFFDLVTDELTKIMGPMASMIVRDHVAALSESIHKFPQLRAKELRDSLSKEILNDKLKTAFCEWFAKQL